MKSLLLIFTLIQIIACNPQAKTDNPKIDRNNIRNDSVSSTYNLDSLISIINFKSKFWIKSWSNDFNINDFSFTSEGNLETANQWSNQSKDNDFLKLYRDLLFYSNDSLMYVDIYSYKVGLVKEHNKTYGNFDADTKINLYDMANNRNRLLITVGTVATYDDCVWLDDNNFMLLGSYSDYVEKKECFIPFIFVYDIQRNYYWEYRFKRHMDFLNKEYFIKRYPMIKIK